MPNSLANESADAWLRDPTAATVNPLASRSLVCRWAIPPVPRIPQRSVEDIRTPPEPTEVAASFKECYLAATPACCRPAKTVGLVRHAAVCHRKVDADTGGGAGVVRLVERVAV